MELVLSWVHLFFCCWLCYIVLYRIRLCLNLRVFSNEKMKLMLTWVHFLFYKAYTVLCIWLYLSLRALWGFDEKMKFVVNWVHFLFRCWLGLGLYRSRHLTLSQSQDSLTDEKMKLVLNWVHFLSRCWLGLYCSRHLTLSQSQDSLTDEKMKLVSLVLN